MRTDSKSRLDNILTRDITFGTLCTLVVLGGIGLAHALAMPWGVVAALGFSLLYLSLYDIRFMLLPDAVTLPLVALGFVNVIWMEPPLLDRALGAGIGFIALPLLNHIYRRVRGREGIGFGDAKLLAAAGAWLGWASLPLVLLVASLTGLLFGLARAVGARRFDGGAAIPFGPFLALGFFLVFCWDVAPESLRW